MVLARILNSRRDLSSLRVCKVPRDGYYRLNPLYGQYSLTSPEPQMPRFMHLARAIVFWRCRVDQAEAKSQWYVFLTVPRPQLHGLMLLCAPQIYLLSKRPQVPDELVSGHRLRCLADSWHSPSLRLASNRLPGSHRASTEYTPAGICAYYSGLCRPRCSCFP